MRKNLTIQVLIAMLLGIAMGALFPEQAVNLKFLGDVFIRLIKMIVAPIVFLTIVTGISGMENISKVGRLGLRSIIYFEVASTLAILIGMGVMNIFHPGANLQMPNDKSVDIATYVNKSAAQEHGITSLLNNIIPESFLGAFVKGDLLSVLFIAVLFGIALASMGEAGKKLEKTCETLTQVFFGIINLLMKIAPLGAFGAMAFSVGKFGLASLLPLLNLVLLAIASMAFFVFVVLGLIGRYYKVPLLPFLRHIREEIMIVLGTASSETVLPRLMKKLEIYGCPRQIVGMVVPTGYAFNLDGTALYLAMCTLFIAQVYAIDLSFYQQASILGIMLLTSKGAAGVTGSGFVVLAATVSATGILPTEGLALLLGIDRFMSTARAITNLIGNGFAALIIAKMEKPV